MPSLAKEKQNKTLYAQHSARQVPHHKYYCRCLALSHNCGPLTMKKRCQVLGQLSGPEVRLETAAGGKGSNPTAQPLLPWGSAAPSREDVAHHATGSRNSHRPPGKRSGVRKEIFQSFAIFYLGIGKLSTTKAHSGFLNVVSYIFFTSH